MKIPSIKKSMWQMIISLLILATFISTVLISPYYNKNKTSVEPISFLGTYALDNKSDLLPFNDSTYIDACENRSVTFRGNFDRPLKKGTQIFFFMEYLEVRIYLNDEEIYSWGSEETYPGFMRSNGAAWGHCVLPDSISPTDEVTVYLMSKYSNNYNSAYHDFLDSMQIGDSGALARLILTDNWPYLLIGLLLFLISLGLQLFILFMSRQKVKTHTSIYYCAYFILFASLWIVINPIYSTLVFDNAPLVMLLETISMWLFSSFLLAYFGAFMQTKAKQANDILLFVFVSALVLFLIMQMLGFADAYAVRDIHNILICITGVIFMFIFRYEVRHSEKSEICTLALPGLIYIAFGLLEILNYRFEWLPRGAILTVGFAIFIMVLFIFAVRQLHSNLEMALRAGELEKSLIQSHTAVMLTQIQPHFLYNALTGIKTLCGSNPSQAEDAMEHFAYFLRRNLDSLSDTNLITFEKEISHVNDYFYLEKMRFNERVNLIMELEFCDFLLPPLTIQPLVENAVRYGITKKEDGGTVTITSRLEDNQIIITIADDGIGFDTSLHKDNERSHIGIENVRRRLKIECGGSLEVISKKDIGTEVHITLPGKDTFI